MIEYIIYAVAVFYATLIFYLAIMNIARSKGSLDKFQKIVFAPIVLIGLVLDVLFRWTVGAIVLLDISPNALFTSVLQRHVRKDTWRGKVARFICSKLLDEFDPSGRHC